MSVLPILFLMIYSMMINIDLREAFNVRKHAAAVGHAQVFFGGSVEYAIGLYFILLIPTSGITAA